jgi:hypothetical protein
MKLAIMAGLAFAGLMDEVDDLNPGGGAPKAEVDAEPTPSVAKEPEPEAVDEIKAAADAGTPKVALVGKYADRIPVQLKDAAHLARLKAEHGDVEVQP